MKRDLEIVGEKRKKEQQAEGIGEVDRVIQENLGNKKRKNNSNTEERNQGQPHP